MDGPAPPAEPLGNWLALGLIAATSPSRRHRIEAFYGSLEEAAQAGPSAWRRHDLLPTPGGGGTLRAASGSTEPEVLRHLEDTERWVADQLERSRRMGLSILHKGGEGYPELLGVAPDPPPVIYVKGDPALLEPPAVAVVGARNASRYGREVALSLGGGLARAGLAVVSGGARGIDSAAHRGALEAGGVTVSVMGCGLDVIYPPENAALFGRIVERGLLVSEYPLGTAPLPRHFPVRNRVIAGLSLAVVVVEGKFGSGSLITAARALDANRDVMAVPGLVTSRLSDGPNSLIAEGARLVRSAADVLQGLPDWAGVRPAGGEAPRPGSGRGEPPDEVRELLEVLDPHDGASADEVAASLGVGAGEALGRLTALELDGWIEQTAGGRYVRRP